MAPASDVLKPKDPTDLYYSQGISAKYCIPHVTAALPPIKPAAREAASIGYHPLLHQHVARASNHVAASSQNGLVPSGWPTRLHGPLAWRRDDLADVRNFVYVLSEQEQKEVASALQHFKGESFGHTGSGSDSYVTALNIPVSTVTRATFPLPDLGKRLVQLQDLIYDGPGFVIVRGLKLEAYGDVDIAVIFLGVSSYIAERRGKQDRRGSMLSELKQISSWCKVVLVMSSRSRSQPVPRREK
jgi:hypothetical protein